jgi:SanA protein
MSEPAAAPVVPPRRFWRRRPLVSAALVLTALGAAGNVYVIAEARGRIRSDFATLPVSPYAMVLGNRVLRDGRPAHELTLRLETGLALYRAKLARQIIVSGMVEGPYDEPDGMAAWLLARGVPPSDLVIDRGGYRTAASMADAAASGVRSMLIVSQRYHLARSLYLAAHAGIDAVAVPCADGRSIMQNLHAQLRELLARPEIVVEVALRGVRG